MQPTEQLNIACCIFFPNMTCYFRLIHIQHERGLGGNIRISTKVSIDLSLSSVFRQSKVMGTGKRTCLVNGTKMEWLLEAYDVFRHAYESLSVIYLEGLTCGCDDKLH
jgi:hypothetical protein